MLLPLTRSTILANKLRFESNVDYDEVYKMIKDGLDMDYRTSDGYSLLEIAGMKQRLDIVDILYRSTYQEI